MAVSIHLPRPTPWYLFSPVHHDRLAILSRINHGANPQVLSTLKDDPMFLELMEKLIKPYVVVNVENLDPIKIWLILHSLASLLHNPGSDVLKRLEEGILLHTFGAWEVKQMVDLLVGE